MTKTKEQLNEERVQIRLGKELKKQASEVCKKEGESLSSVVRGLLKAWTRKHK